MPTTTTSLSARRHMNESQRAVVAARLSTLKDGQRSDYSRSAQIPTCTQSQAASLLNVSTRNIGNAKKIMREAPEKIKDIEGGRHD